LNWKGFRIRRAFFVLIRDLVEEKFKNKSQFGWNYIIWETKDYIVTYAKIQRPNEEWPRVKLKGFAKIKPNLGLDWGFSQIKNCNQK